ncbi:10590_t:CDS:2 [Acaulospora morrowiae]|uniref:10590_t:CDS:1 n=1 Tax=Acaulospora morrowiae TaxID=94023 RepID=A0A9N8YKZ3_9GLOM|nr:10590_t:CDS:2 [Acaulospora morrowiae]
MVCDLFAIFRHYSHQKRSRRYQTYRSLTFGGSGGGGGAREGDGGVRANHSSNPYVIAGFVMTVNARSFWSIHSKHSRIYAEITQASSNVGVRRIKIVSSRDFPDTLNACEPVNASIVKIIAMFLNGLPENISLDINFEIVQDKRRRTNPKVIWLTKFRKSRRESFSSRAIMNGSSRPRVATTLTTQFISAFMPTGTTIVNQRLTGNSRRVV